MQKTGGRWCWDMAFYSIYSNTFGIEKDAGTIDVTALSKLEPYINGITRPNMLTASYSLLLTVRDHSYSEKVFRLTLFTPDYVLYIALTEEEYRSLPVEGDGRTNMYELLYVLDGTVYLTVEGERDRYGKNDACFLSPQLVHAMESENDFTAVTVFYSQEYLCNMIEDDQTKFLKTLLYRDYTKFFIQTVNKEQSFARDIPWYFWNIFEGLIYPIPSNTAIINIYLSRPLVALESFSEYMVVPVRCKKNADQILFERITEVMRKTHGRATRKQLEGELLYSGDYLNKIVKRHTDMSISQYGNVFVMEYSAWLLANTTKSVSDICEELLFSNRTTFYKLFKETYGMTPKEYREKKISGEE